MTHLGKADWTDRDRVRRMAASYQVRYDTAFWDSFGEIVDSGHREAVADFGCGPGLLLADLARKYSARFAYGVDESREMLQQAEASMNAVESLASYSLLVANFDSQGIPLDENSVDLAFCGFMLHEVASPSGFVSQVYRVVRSGGLYTVYDYVSGDREAFIRKMASQGMDRERASLRYPHMCKHSVLDIENLLTSAGFGNVRSVVMDGMRSVVAGLK
jgi:ubiquinone/menaquinone biosynthesis C-methylase UbiE